MGRARGKKAKKLERSRILLDGPQGCGLSSIVSWLGRDDTDTTIGSFPLKVNEYGNLFLDDDMTKYRGFNVYHPYPGYGRCMYRPAIKFYYQQALAVVYVIDSNQPELMSQNSEELSILENIISDEDLKDVPIIAIANKQDLPDAKSPAELEEMINKKETRHIKVFPTTATTGEGVNECFDWLIDEITRRREQQAATEPFKDVASDVKEQGKTGMKMAKEAWKKLSGILGSSKNKG